MKKKEDTPTTDQELMEMSDGILNSSAPSSADKRHERLKINHGPPSATKTLTGAQIAQTMLSANLTDKKFYQEPSKWISIFNEFHKITFFYKSDSVLRNGHKVDMKTYMAFVRTTIKEMGLARNFSKQCVDDMVTLWLSREKDQFLNEMRTRLAFRPSKEDLIRAWVKAATRREDQVNIAVMRHFIWQVRRKLYGLEVEHHMMPILYGKSGGGKSQAVIKLLKPVEDLSLSMDLSIFSDQFRTRLFTKAYVMFFDEMAKSDRADIDRLKNVITSPTVDFRLMHSENLESAPQNCTFIGCSNDTVYDKIYDPTSARRYWQLDCADKLDWPTINTIPYLDLWKSVDENSPCPLIPVLTNISDVQDKKIRSKDLIEDWAEAMADALGLTSTDLPFLGELIQVKKDESEWEGALERLLYSNALNVLVDEKYYQDVTTYVKKNNLRGKLSFMRVALKSAIRARPERDDNLFAFSKIAVRDGDSSAWIERHLRKIADHLCCESVQDLMASSRGITKEGLIKNDSERHVKDDRSNVNDRTRFILGWDTKLKREALITKIQLVAIEFSSLQDLAKEHKLKLDELNKKAGAVKNIGRYKSFDEVAHHLTNSQILAKNDSLKILEEKNKNAKLLREQLAKAGDDLSAIELQIKTVEKEINTLQVYIDGFDKEILQYRASYETVSTDEATRVFPSLDQIRSDMRLDLHRESFADVLDNIGKKLSKLKDLKVSERDRASRAATGCMSKFKSDWDEECYDLEPSIQHAAEFLEKYNSLKDEDLPKYESRFREMFTKKGLNAVTILDQTMREKVDEIRDSIELINKPLKNTLYSPTTKISLLCKDIENSRSVTDFQARIRKCLSRTTEEFDRERQLEAFQAVNELVEYLTSKDTETDRERALDVRNWLEFYAVETNIETGKIENYYWSSGGGSGGQKTKLTLTILASAMAYQFGLTEDAVSADSFNFVMLDEAFARMDQKNSELVLSIFKEVGFQIMVASPPMYGFLVEPHIDCLHFASINEAKNKSRIYTATRLQTEQILGRKLHPKKANGSLSVSQ